jgi:hypothetical protein
VRRLLSTVVVAAVGVVGVALFAWAEYVHWRASRRLLGDDTAAHDDAHDTAGTGTEAVVVLGYRNRSRRANFVNRYRVRVGLRSLRADSGHGVLVLCGGAVGGGIPEAELMARYARERRGYTGEIRLDTLSTTTRENIRHAIPLIGDADTIKIVSHAPHAEVGRRYLWDLRPDLAARLVRGEDYRFGEAPLLKIAAAFIAARHRARGAGD